MVAKLGDPAPGGGTHEFYFVPQAINDNGDVSFDSSLSEFPNGGEGLFLSRHGVNTQITRTGLPAPGTSTTFGTYGMIAPPGSGINNNGDMAFAFALGFPDPNPLPFSTIAGVWRYDASHNTVTKVHVPGDPAPGHTTFQGTSISPTINNNGVVIAVGIIDTDKGYCHAPECNSPPHTLGLGRGIYTADRHNRISKIIVPGDPAPGGLTSTFDDAYDPDINDGGDVVFAAHVTGETCGFVTILGCSDSLYLYRSSTGRISSIAHQGDPAPGGGNFLIVSDGQINNRGDMTYIGNLVTLTADEKLRVILTDRRGVSRTIAQTGASLPGGVMVNTAYHGSLAINNSGVVAFVAKLDADVNGDNIPDTGVYVDHGGIITTVVRTGTVIPGLGTVTHTNELDIVDVPIPPFPGVDINDRGEVLTQVVLENGENYIVVASPRGNNLRH